jgi:hypothetical protein
VAKQVKGYVAYLWCWLYVLYLLMIYCEFT